MLGLVLLISEWVGNWSWSIGGGFRVVVWGEAEENLVEWIPARALTPKTLPLADETNGAWSWTWAERDRIALLPGVVRGRGWSWTNGPSRCGWD